ncbi:AcfA family outer membrane beta-barrel protein [Oceanospirillum sp.]|uniref:AcfA family outer membrane beta-barrel protein n=1 Tax=Oceanospirillum sp. TaxID=2021254 RepID=UPI003A947EFE
MKKYLPLALLAISPLSQADAYLQLGLGTVEMDHDEAVVFSDSTRLKPDSNDSSQQITLGYRFESFGIEISHRNMEGTEDHEFSTLTAIPSLPSGVTGGTPNEYEEDKDATFDASQVAIKGVYYWDLDQQWLLKSGLGLTYTDYEMRASYVRSWEEDKPGEDWEYDQVVSQSKETDTAWGGIASIGVHYTPLPDSVPGLNLGVEASVATDKYNTASALYGTLGWRF